jgi:hypothetical protein
MKFSSFIEVNYFVHIQDPDLLKWLQNYEPGIEEVVDEGVDHGIGHGQPVEEQVNVFDVAVAGDARIVVHRDEVQVIRQPAQGEQRHHHDEHPHDLHDKST